MLFSMAITQPNQHRRGAGRARRIGHGQGLAGSVPDAILLVDRQWVELGKQPALGLGEVQRDGCRLAAIGEKLPDVVHMRPRLVFWRKLLQRDESRCQRLGDDPFVVARDSLLWHRRTPRLVAISF